MEHLICKFSTFRREISNNGKSWHYTTTVEDTLLKQRGRKGIY